MGSKLKSDVHHGDGASPGKIFIGGLPKDTTYATFNKHFGKYGEITDSVIMKDRISGAPRGFGFITYAHPSVVDKVIEDTHVINGKQVEIKRTIPKGAGQLKDFKTKKIFVGGIPAAVSEDELKSFFSAYGKVVEHQIIRDHETNRSRGFGFIIFDNEDEVDDLLSKGNMIDFAGTQVEIKKAEPKKPSNPPPAPAYGSNSRARPFGDGYGGYGGPYGGFDAGFGPGPGPYRTPGSLGGRLGAYGGYGSGAEFSGYGGFGSGSLGGYRGESSLGYSSRFGPYGGGFSGGYGAGNIGGYGRGEGYGGYGGSGYGNGYDSSSGAGYAGAGGLYGKGGYSGNSRYHPYAR
ncbi:hypothetical protein Nepgr_007674 [Nepenthes gracilis]|uniref:RRM domain-containing protein n=1 Tax=Nepenthes gracilis TaxID=150966 RepID=A0AAD3XIJ6_NEPGR|nr:hypothetical protein Nepgr_007674 [Nepenthes gracilis]